MASTPSPLGVSLPLSVTQNPQSTLWASVQFCVSGTGWVLGHPPWGPTPSSRPRRAQPWLHRAALCGETQQSPNRPIACRIRRRRERPERRRVRRFCFRRIGRECAGRVPAAVCRAGTRRCTGPRTMDDRTMSPSCCCAAPTGPSRPTTGTAALRCTAEPKPQQPRACRRTPKQYAERGGKLALYEAAERLVPPAPRLTAPPPPPRARCPIPPNAAGTDGCAVGARRRRSPIQRAGRRRSTRTVTDALAARLAVHCCTRGLQCRVHLARAAAPIGSAKRACARKCSAVRRTARGDIQTRTTHDAGRVCLSADSADGLGLVLQAEQQRPAMGEVRPFAVHVGLHSGARRCGIVGKI